MVFFLLRSQRDQNIKNADGNRSRKMVSFCYYTTTPFPNDPISDMNITLKIARVNFKKRLPYQVKIFSSEELQEFIRQGAVIRKNKQYQLVIHYRQFIIECPILLMNDGRYRMIWPSFLLPNRPYPVFVYLFAIVTYISSSLSQRGAADKTRNFFGLTTFDHSTVCRVLPRFFPILPYLVQYGAQILTDWGAGTSTAVRKKHWNNAQNVQAQELFKFIEPTLRSPPEFGEWLAYWYFEDTGKFIV